MKDRTVHIMPNGGACESDALPARSVAAVKGKDGELIVLGDHLLMRYGSGTQVVRVRDITASGGLKIDRFWGGVQWAESKATVSPTDERILGHLPESDPRSRSAAFRGGK